MQGHGCMVTQTRHVLDHLDASCNNHNETLFKSSVILTKNYWQKKKCDIETVMWFPYNYNLLRLPNIHIYTGIDKIARSKLHKVGWQKEICCFCCPYNNTNLPRTNEAIWWPVSLPSVAAATMGKFLSNLSLWKIVVKEHGSS